MYKNNLSLCQRFVDLSIKAWKEGDMPQHASYRSLCHESKMRNQSWPEQLALTTLWRISKEAKVRSRFMFNMAPIWFTLLFPHVPLV